MSFVMVGAGINGTLDIFQKTLDIANAIKKNTNFKAIILRQLYFELSANLDLFRLIEKNKKITLDSKVLTWLLDNYSTEVLRTFMLGEENAITKFPDLENNLYDEENENNNNLPENGYQFIRYLILRVKSLKTAATAPDLFGTINVTLRLKRIHEYTVKLYEVISKNKSLETLQNSMTKKFIASKK